MLNLPEHVQKFMQTFKDKGYEIFLVGGGVRDLLLGKKTDNWDFTTNAKPEEILKLFPQAFYHNKYGTVTVPIKKDSKTYFFEVTPFRKEGKYSDFRHPDKIEWADTVEEDLARRDFTINAMAYDGEKIIDPFGGREDLRNKLIRAVGDPDKRFSEDALRLLRAVRFASQLGFQIEPETYKSIVKNAPLIQKISWERIRDEFFKILQSPYSADGILVLKNTGLLHHILPELEECFKTPQKSPKRHHIYDVGTHLIESLRHCPSKDVITRFATLIHDIGKPKTFKRTEEGVITFYNHEVIGAKMADQIARRFRLANKQRDKLVRLVRYHQFTVDEKQTDRALKRFIRNVGKENLEDILALRVADRIGSGVKPTSWRLELFKKRLQEVQKQPFTIKDLKIDGYDVMRILGLKPGPEVGRVLKEIFEKVEKGELKNERGELVEELKKLSTKP